MCYLRSSVPFQCFHSQDLPNFTAQVEGKVVFSTRGSSANSYFSAPYLTFSTTDMDVEVFLSAKFSVHQRKSPHQQSVSSPLTELPIIQFEVSSMIHKEVAS